MADQRIKAVLKDDGFMHNFSSLPKIHRLHYIYDLLFVLVSRDIKLRYRRSIAGIGWSLINPLTELLILGFVFGRVLSIDTPHYLIFLFTGLLGWNWFREGLSNTTGIIVNNASLIKLPGIPVFTLPIATVLTHFVHYLIALPILLMMILLDDLLITSALAAAPLIMVIQFVFTLSLGYFLAALQVNFRDTQYLLGIALGLGFFVSGIFFDPATLGPQYQILFYLNPMSVLITAYRTIYLEGSFPDPTPLIILAVISTLMLVIGLSFFDHASESFAEEI